MNKSNFLWAVALISAFAAGSYYNQQNQPIKISNSQTGASYQGTNSGVESTKKSAVIKQQFNGEVHVVNQGESIMAAVKLAKPGDTIQVMPGTYNETVYIDKDSIRILGVIKQGQWPTMHGNGELNDAILYSGNNIVVENMKITKYKGNGIMGQAGNNFEIRNNLIVDTGVYGIFPQLGKNGIVEYNIISGIEDAAIYVGMSDNIHVAHNHVFSNVAGIEIENSRHAIVENNLVYDNTGGILAFVTPGLPIKTTYDVIIRNNFVHNNNHKNFGAPGSTVAGIPPGTGILVMAADDVIIEDNVITDNKTAGILITDHHHAANITIDPESEPNADRVSILNNTMVNNGYDTIDEVKALALTEFKSGSIEIVRVGGSKDSCIINRHQYITVGIDDFAECNYTNTDDVISYILDEPVPARKIEGKDQGKIAYLGVCTGCHAYTGQLIGPPIKDIQSIYQGNPEALASYIAKPFKKRPTFPEMPPQNYLPEETRLAVAEYVLSLKN